MTSNYPIYIVSKGRYGTNLTAKALERMGQPYFVVVEPQEVEMYELALDRAKILTLPDEFPYDTFDDLGTTKSRGPGRARNFAWDHAISIGAKWHWVMDDNIKAFNRSHMNRRHYANTPAIFKAMEDFCDRYENIAIAGPNYTMFVKDFQKIPAYYLNTRIYSCLLIRNDIPYRWRGRYNEDTDICLRVLKDGWCTVQFNAFLQGKMGTQLLRGGNTEAFYKKEGTINKSQMLADMHPDVAVVVWKFGRWHHHVDYRPFRKNVLKLKKDVVIEDRVNNYNMVLRPLRKVSNKIIF